MTDKEIIKDLQAQLDQAMFVADYFMSRCRQYESQIRKLSKVEKTFNSDVEKILFYRDFK